MLSMNRTWKPLPSIVLLVAFAATGGVAKDLGQSDYRSWSKDDVKKLLRDSPWTKQFTYGHAVLIPTDQGSPELRPELSPEITYVVQFRSAQVIRQALVRQQQIELHYEKMSEAQKHAFDESASRFLTNAFPETIIVRVEYSSNAPLFATNLTNYWQTVDRKQTMQTMFLIVGERRILPSEINIGQGGARAFEMVFPRSVDGHPVLDPTT